MDQPIVWAYWNHEPSYHLKRMHSRPSLFTLGEWSDRWIQRLRSEECIKKAADDGINVIYTNFYKGFGLEYEKIEIEETKALIQIAHRYGIKVLGYCQLDSVYYETFLAEDPDAIKMAAKNVDGTPRMWGGDSYYRWSTCYNSAEFISYIKKVIDFALEDVGVDGFHFDNSYMVECFCENCKKDFRRYLKETVSDPISIMGIPNFDYVEIPHYANKPAINFDPLYFLWHKYRQHKCAQVQNEIFRYVKEKSGEKALVLHNPGFPRGSWDYLRFGYNPEFHEPWCDFVMAENRDNLVSKDGKVTTQILSYKLAERFGYWVFESSWRTVENKNDSLVFDTAAYPETYFQIAYYLSQSMIFGALVGTPWLMRSTHRGDEMLQDDPLQRQTHQKVIAYFKEHKSLYEGKPLNRVKVLYSADNLLNFCTTGLDAFKDVVNRIHNANIPFSVVVKGDIPSLEKEQTIVVPELFFADDELCEYLEQAAQRGCRVLVLGEYNVCNIYGKAKDLTRNIPGEKLFVRKKMADHWEAEIKAGASIDFRLSCKSLVLELKVDQNGDLLLHLLNTQDTAPMDVELELVGLEGYEPAKVYSFEDVSLRAGEKVIKLEGFKTMATLKLRKNR